MLKYVRFQVIDEENNIKITNMEISDKQLVMYYYVENENQIFNDFNKIKSEFYKYGNVKINYLKKHDDYQTLTMLIEFYSETELTLFVLKYE